MHDTQPGAPAKLSGPLLLYDDACGFCGWWVQWVLAQERDPQDLRFAGLNGPFGVALRLNHPSVATADSIVWLAPPAGGGLPLLRSDAVLAVLRHVGGIWRAVALLGALVPRPLRDHIYDLVARHRHRLAGTERCVLPRPEQRHRFLDLAGRNDCSPPR